MIRGWSSPRNVGISGQLLTWKARAACASIAAPTTANAYAMFEIASGVKSPEWRSTTGASASRSLADVGPAGEGMCQVHAGCSSSG